MRQLKELETDQTPRGTPESLLEKKDSTADVASGNINKKERRNSIDAICAKNADDVTKKLFSRLKIMDKSNIKDIINNPKIQYETALKVQARKKLQLKMRNQLKTLSEGENRGFPELEADMTVDAHRIPSSLIEEIAKTIDLNMLSGSDDNIEPSHEEPEDLEVVTKNLGGEDLLYQAEMFLMNSSEPILEDMCENDKAEENTESATETLVISDPSDLKIVDEKLGLTSSDGLKSTLSFSNKTTAITENRLWNISPPAEPEKKPPPPPHSPIEIQDDWNASSDINKSDNQQNLVPDKTEAEKLKDLAWEQERLKDEAREREKSRITPNERLERSQSITSSSSRERIQPAARRDISDHSMSPHDRIKGRDYENVRREKETSRDRDFGGRNLKPVDIWDERDKSTNRKQSRWNDSEKEDRNKGNDSWDTDRKKDQQQQSRQSKPFDVWENPPEKYKSSEQNSRPMDSDFRMNRPRPLIPVATPPSDRRPMNESRIQPHNQPLFPPLIQLDARLPPVVPPITYAPEPLMSLHIDPPPDLEIVVPSDSPINSPVRQDPEPQSAPFRQDPEPQPEIQIAKCSDDIMSNIYRTKLNNFDSTQNPPDLDSILKPKPFNFKGSFKRKNNNNNIKNDRVSPYSRGDREKTEDRDRRNERFDRRSRSRTRRSRSRNNRRSRSHSKNRAATKQQNDSMDVSIEGLKSSMVSLKRMSEIDGEITKVMEKIQGYDKVIANMQNERQHALKTFSKLQIERKNILQNVIKQAKDYVSPHIEVVSSTLPQISEETSSSNNSKDAIHPSKDDSVNYMNSFTKTPVSTTTTKKNFTESGKKRKLEDDRKHDEKRRRETSKEPTTITSETRESTPSNANRTKSATPVPPPTTSNQHSKSSNQKSAKLSSKKDHKDHRHHHKKDSESKSSVAKSLHLEKETTQQSDTTDSSANSSKKKKSDFLMAESKLDENVSQTPATVTPSKKSKSSDQKIRKLNENHLKKALKNAKIEKARKNTVVFDESCFITLVDYSLVDVSIKLKRLEPADLDDKDSIKKLIIKEELKEPEPENPPIELFCSTKDEPMEIIEADRLKEEIEVNDPLNVSEEIIIDNEPGEMKWTGEYDKHMMPIVHVKVIENCIVCAAENGVIYKYSIATGEVLDTFTKHTMICNSFIYDEQEFIYTMSSDGFMYKFKFQVKQEQNFVGNFC